MSTQTERTFAGIDLSAVMQDLLENANRQKEFDSSQYLHDRWKSEKISGVAAEGARYAIWELVGGENSSLKEIASLTVLTAKQLLRSVAGVNEEARCLMQQEQHLRRVFNGHEVIVSLKNDTKKFEHADSFYEGDELVIWMPPLKELARFKVNNVRAVTHKYAPAGE